MSSPQTRQFLRSMAPLRRSDPLAHDVPVHIVTENTSSSPRSTGSTYHRIGAQSENTASMGGFQTTNGVRESPAARAFRQSLCTDLVTIVCAHEHELLVPRDVATHSGCIQRMLETGFRESQDGVIRLPTFEPELVEKVFRFCYEDHLLNREARLRRVRRQLFPSNETVPAATAVAGTSLPQSPRRHASTSAAVAIPVPNLSHNVCFSLGSPAAELSSSLSSSFGSPPQPTNSAHRLLGTSWNGAPSAPVFATSPPPAYPPLALHSVTKTAPAPPLKSSLDSRVVFCFDLSSDNVLEVVMIAHFLDVPELLEAACRFVAHHMDAVVSLNGLPREVVECIYSHLRPEQLCEAEASGKYTDVPTFDSSNLWRSAFEQKNWDTNELMYEASWTHAQAGSFLPLEWPALGCATDCSDEHALSAMSWKEHFLQRNIQMRLDGFLVKQPLQPLLAHVEHCGQHVLALRLPRAFVEHHLTMPVSQFVALFSRLRVLDLSHVPQPSVHAVQVLQHVNTSGRPPLRVLRVSSALLDDAHLRSLCQVLAHPRCALRSLDVSSNALTPQALLILANLLESDVGAALSLGALSLAENRLHCHDAAAAETFSRFVHVVAARNRLRVLDLSRNELSLSALTTPLVLSSLSLNHSLHVLLLGDNPLTDSPPAAFRSLLTQRPPALRLLSLRNCGLDAVHAQVLAEVLTTNNNTNGGAGDSNRALQVLDLSENCFGRDSAAHLALLLERNTALTQYVAAAHVLWCSVAW